MNGFFTFSIRQWQSNILYSPKRVWDRCLSLGTAKYNAKIVSSRIILLTGMEVTL